jgi:hypothetical protein
VEQLGGFGLQQIADGDAGPGADDGGDVAFVDNIVQVGFYPQADDKLVVCFFDPNPFRLVLGGIFVVPLFPGFFFLGLEFAELLPSSHAGGVASETWPRAAWQPLRPSGRSPCRAAGGQGHSGG